MTLTATNAKSAGAGGLAVDERSQTMTPFEAATSISDTIIRFRAKWNGAGFSAFDIDCALASACRAVGLVNPSDINKVRTVLKHRTWELDAATPLEAAASVAQTLLRAKGQWHGADTVSAHIAHAVFVTCEVLGFDDYENGDDHGEELFYDLAVELRERAGAAAA
jgi:hypothetical protein